MRYWGEPEGESPAEKKAVTIRQWKEGKAKKKAAGKSAKPAGKGVERKDRCHLASLPARQASPAKGAIEWLKQRPDREAAFDAKFGRGAAAAQLRPKHNGPAAPASNPKRRDVDALKADPRIASTTAVARISAAIGRACCLPTGK